MLLYEKIGTNKGGFCLQVIKKRLFDIFSFVLVSHANLRADYAVALLADRGWWGRVGYLCTEWRRRELRVCSVVRSVARAANIAFWALRARLAI
jgi:hypothetical protein